MGKDAPNELLLLLETLRDVGVLTDEKHEDALRRLEAKIAEKWEAWMAPRLGV